MGSLRPPFFQRSDLLLFSICSIDRHQPKLKMLVYLDKLKVSSNFRTCGDPVNSKLDRIQNHQGASGHVCEFFLFEWIEKIRLKAPHLDLGPLD